jgi:DNA-binding LytR/AlgR family response regulator
MNILIIEDEPWAARDLENLIRKLEPEVNLLPTISSVRGAKKWLTENPPPSLIMSDIQLSDGISFEIFEQLNLQCPIIFTTAYNDYAIRAFKLNSIDYLLKPISEKELQAALEKYRSLRPGTLLEEQVRSLVSNWGQTYKTYKERFLALHRNALVPVVVSEIGFFHKEELIYVHTLGGEKYISEHHTMDEIESLVNPELFFRVNRQYLIQINAVDSVKSTHKGLSVRLKPPLQATLDISREKAAAFKKWLG